MANYVKTEDGYKEIRKEIGFVANETVLASGIIKEGTPRYTNTNTGLTLSDLKKWKVWGFRFYTDPLNTYSYLGITIGGVGLYATAQSGTVAAGWLDKDNQIIHVISSYFDDPKLNFSSNFMQFKSLVDLNTVPGTNGCIISDTGNITNDAIVWFHNRDQVPTGSKILWEIRGLIK